MTSWVANVVGLLGSATLARSVGPATEPDAVRRGPELLAWRRGGTSVTGLPSCSSPGPIGKLRSVPRRSSSTTIPFSIRVTAPTKPVVASSSTRPALTGSSVLTTLPAFCQPLASTSVA